MTLPLLKEGQVAVVQSEVDTGIVLTPEGQRHLGEGEWFLVFDSIEEAQEFAMSVVLDKPEVECGLYDFKGNYLGPYRRAE